MSAVSAFLSPRAADACQRSPRQYADMKRSVRPFVAHSDVSSSRPQQHEVESMGDTIGNRSRNCAGSRNEARTYLREVFRQHVTDPAKIVAQKVGTSPDSVESYRSGNIPQSWAQMIAFCRAYPAFGLEVLELMNIDIDADRQAYALFLQLQKQVRGE